MLSSPRVRPARPWVVVLMVQYPVQGFWRWGVAPKSCCHLCLTVTSWDPTVWTLEPLDSSPMHLKLGDSTR